MDFMEIALKAAAEKEPVGITVCHKAVVQWLFFANLITKKERDAIFSMRPRPPYEKFLVESTDTQLDRSKLSNLGAGNVLGFCGVTDPMNLKHSMVTLGNGLLAGVNNGYATYAKHPSDKYAQVKIEDLYWDKSDAFLGDSTKRKYLFNILGLLRTE